MATVEASAIALQDQTEVAGENLPQVASSKRLAWLWLLLVPAVLLPAAFFVRLPQSPLENAIQLIKAGKAAAALPLLEDIAQRQPEGSIYLPWLAQCYLSTDRIAEGRTALDTAIKVKSPCASVIPVVLSFSKYYRQKSDFSEAERLLNSAQTLCPPSEFEDERKSIFEDWAEDDSRKNLTADAISHLEMLVALEGTPGETHAHRLAELYRQQAAIEETQNGDDNKAIGLLEKSLTVCDEPASRMALGNLYAKNSDFKKAAAHLKQVCKTDQNNLEARHRLIEMSMKMNDFQGAQEAATELADREKSVENFGLLAEINLKLLNFAGAVRALEDANSLTQKDLVLLGRLEAALNDWADDLMKHGKQDDSIAVKGRAERIAEQIKAIQKEQNPEQAEAKETPQNPGIVPGALPIVLTTSRIWLSRGSFTPEGEIKLKNILNEPISEMALTVAFYDITLKKRTGSVTVNAAGANHPILPGQTRVLCFSSPNIVRAEHKLSVLIYWKGKLIRELPVVKER